MYMQFSNYFNKMDDSAINQFLHTTLGYSQPLLIDYIKCCASSAKSETELTTKLEEYGFTKSNTLNDFIIKLYQQYGIKQPILSDYQKAELKLLQQKKENDSYQLVEKEENEVEQELECDDPIIKAIEALQKKGETDLSVEEKDELKKLLKEKDKIERDALSHRIIDREKSKKGMIVVKG